MAYDEHDFEKDLKDAVDEAIDDKMWELSEKLDQRERALEKKIEVWGSIAQKFEEESNNRQYYERSYNKQALRYDYEILCAKSVLAMMPRREKERRKSKVMIPCGIIAALCSPILAFFDFPLLFKKIITDTGSVILFPALFGALLFLTFFVVPLRMIKRRYFFVFMITDFLLFFIRIHSYKKMIDYYSLIIVAMVLGGAAVAFGILYISAGCGVDLFDFDSGWDGHVVNADKNFCVDECAKIIENEGRVGNDKLSRENILMLTNQDNLKDIKYSDSYARWRGLIDLGKNKIPCNIFWMIVYMSGVIACYLYL